MKIKKQHMMHAVEISSFGGPEQLAVVRRPRPVPKAGEVLIKIAAAGINRPDLLQRQGHYPPPPGVTDIPGLEVAGTIIESQSPQWPPGTEVCALLAGGGYAEYAVAPAEQCLPVPKGLSLTEAAALPETIFTVWNNLFERGNLQKGEMALIHGGASGIGTIAIQMAKAWGAKVVTTAGTDEKCRACEALGADLAINYRTQDFVAEIEKHYGSHPLHVVLDMVGGDYLARNIRLMAPEGRHVSIAFLRGKTAEIDISQLMRRRLTLTGSTLRARPAAEKGALAQGLKEKIWPLIEAGQIRPQICQTFPLAAAQDAHQALEAGAHIGKIVLIV